MNERETSSVGFLPVLETGPGSRRIHFLKAVVPGSGAPSSTVRDRLAAVLEAARRLPTRLRLAFDVRCATLLGDLNLAGWLATEAPARGVAPSRLIAEILDSPELPLDPGVDRALGRLRCVGVAIALGRVKLGSAVFKQVRRHRPEYLVLGRELCENCHRSHFRRAALASLARLARDGGCRVIARGARTTAELAAVRAAGIDLVEEQEPLTLENPGLDYLAACD